MMNLKFWLHQQGFSARELALQLEVPLKTVEDWVYRGVLPSPENRERLSEFVTEECAHHWLIERPQGPLSEGVCQHCGEKREFKNSAEPKTPWQTRRKSATGENQQTDKKPQSKQH